MLQLQYNFNELTAQAQEFKYLSTNSTSVLMEFK